MFDAPQSIHNLLHELTEATKDALGDNLVGIYLHGSLAMGCFNPYKSGLDLIVVVKHNMSVENRQLFAQMMLRLNTKAPEKGIELSIITLSSLRPFQYPTPYEFHFSEKWAEKLVNHQVELSEARVDPDLAAHLTIVKMRGITLFGSPIDKVFPEIPATYYKDSIEGDAKDILSDITSNPVYNVLNLCRVWAYQTERIIVSKQEGAEWALSLEKVPQRSLIQQALDEYMGKMSAPWDTSKLKSFGRSMQQFLSLKAGRAG